MMHIRNSSIFRDLFNGSRNILNCNRYFPIVQNSVSTKSLEEQIGLPAKPKRPLTPYFRFLKQVRSVVAAENPKASNLEVVRLVAEKWKTVDENSKKKLEDEYKKEQISYVEERAKYDNKITDSQRDEIKQLKCEIQEAKERRAFRKRVKELGKPKRPPSAFFKFILQQRSVSPPPSNMAYKEWLNKQTEKWTRLPEAEKDKFKNETKKDIEKYREEVSKWETKMLKLGHFDVVRQNTVIDPQPKSKKNA